MFRFFFITNLFNSKYYFQVFFCIIIAVFNLGQASPHFQALTQARTAAYIVWNVIDAVSK
jgi:hypothetical protein